MASVRSLSSAGLAASLVWAAAGAAVVAPAATPTVPRVASHAVQLSAIASALPLPAAAAPTPPGPIVVAPAESPGERLINSYNAIQPWAQYGVELAAWGVGWLPWPVGLLGAQMNISYSGIEPVTQALVYSLAYALDGQWDLIGPTLTNGVKTGTNNFVQGEINWFLSFFPPLPPIGPLASATPAASAAAESVVPQVAEHVVAPVAVSPSDSAQQVRADIAVAETAAADVVESAGAEPSVAEAAVVETPAVAPRATRAAARAQLSAPVPVAAASTAVADSVASAGDSPAAEAAPPASASKPAPSRGHKGTRGATKDRAGR